MGPLVTSQLFYLAAMTTDGVRYGYILNRWGQIWVYTKGLCDTIDRPGYTKVIKNSTSKIGVSLFQKLEQNTMDLVSQW